MDGYQFIASLVGSVASLAWPIALVFAVYLFRKELRVLLPLLRVKHKDWEASFFRLDQAEREAATLPEAPQQSPPTPEEISKFEQIAEVSPRAAVLELRAELEEAVRSFAEAMGMLSSGRGRGMLQLTRELRNNNLIDSTTSGLLDDLRVIGNTAAHNVDNRITTEEAMRFRNLAERVIAQLFIARMASDMNRRPAPIAPGTLG